MHELVISTDNIDLARIRSLTLKQRKIVELLFRGFTNDEIARHMGLETKTVKFHITRILRMLHVKNRLALVSKYMKYVTYVIR